MASNVTEEFRKVLADLAAKTRAAEIEWTRVNPTTFSWANEKGKVSVQVVERSSIVTEAGKIKVVKDQGYFFQAYDSSGSSRVQINSQESKSLASDLKLLFDLVAESVETKGLNFLKNLLG